MTGPRDDRVSPVPSGTSPTPPSGHRVLDEVNAQLGSHYRWQRRLLGGEQSGAHLVVEDGRTVVLKWEPPGWKADQLRQAFPAVRHATDGGWPAARWLRVGELDGGGAFLLQEYVGGSPLSRLDVPAVRAVLAANARQTGLASPDGVDDSGQLEAVLSGDHPWKSQVARFTPAGAALVQHGDEVTASAGRAAIPVADVVHGDYSGANIMLSADRTTVTFVDCQSAGRGSRARDLADLFRQSFVYPGDDDTGLGLLRAAGVAVAGEQVFARCAVAVTYNNLAWWVENKSPAEFDQACARLHGLFDDLREAAPAPQS